MDIIAHRGASGYLPEHSLVAKALAHGLGADYLEQDVVLSSDHIPIVLHDIHLDTVSDVASKFPMRARDDGRFYAIDFSIDEIKTLQLNERINLATGDACYPNRFPAGSTNFTIPTLAEELEFIQGLNHSTGRDVGIYPEIKKPAWHQAQGGCITEIILSTLADFGYEARNSNCYLQCFDAEETRRIRHELGSELKLIQLIGMNAWQEAPTDFENLLTQEGLQEVAGYADGIGPWIPMALSTPLIQQAHVCGLLVHPYTVRKDDMPERVSTIHELLNRLAELGADGVFSDFPDIRPDTR